MVRERKKQLELSVNYFTSCRNELKVEENSATKDLPGGPPGCLGRGASLKISCCCLGGNEE